MNNSGVYHKPLGNLVIGLCVKVNEKDIGFILQFEHENENGRRPIVWVQFHDGSIMDYFPEQLKSL